MAGLGTRLGTLKTMPRALLTLPLVVAIAYVATKVARTAAPDGALEFVALLAAVGAACAIALAWDDAVPRRPRR